MTTRMQNLRRSSAVLIIPLLMMTGLLGGLTPPTASAAAPPPQKPNFLHAEGSRLVDSYGKEVLLTGVNWFGMETGTFAPHGLWARSMDSMLDEIIALGFNTIRLPYSNEALEPDSRPKQGIDFKVNPDLRGLTGIEIMDKVVEGAQRRGLKIILDQHRPDQWGQSNLWYTDKLTEERWIGHWVMLADRYKGNDTIIGADLHNEPHGEATWGTDNLKTDWRLAAERAGNAILAVNPDWLIIVEGVDSFKGIGYWWGGNLRGAREFPVRLSDPSKLVYSAHDYGPGVAGQNWFSAPDFPANLPRLWEENWAYLVRENIAPVIIGEFGGFSVDDDTEGIWQRALFDYLRDNRISYTYWCYNPNSIDTGGILEDDWTTINEAKHEMLSTYQAPLLGKPQTVASTTNLASTSGRASMPWSKEYLDQIASTVGSQSKKQPVVRIWDDTYSAAAGLQSEREALGAR